MNFDKMQYREDLYISSSALTNFLEFASFLERECCIVTTVKAYLSKYYRVCLPITNTGVDHFEWVSVSLKYYRVVLRINGSNVFQAYNINQQQNDAIKMQYPSRR